MKHPKWADRFQLLSPDILGFITNLDNLFHYLLMTLFDKVEPLSVAVQSSFELLLLYYIYYYLNIYTFYCLLSFFCNRVFSESEVIEFFLSERSWLLWKTMLQLIWFEDLKKFYFIIFNPPPSANGLKSICCFFKKFSVMKMIWIEIFIFLDEKSCQSIFRLQKNWPSRIAWPILQRFFNHLCGLQESDAPAFRLEDELDEKKQYTGNKEIHYYSTHDGLHKVAFGFIRAAMRKHYMGQYWTQKTIK